MGFNLAGMLTLKLKVRPATKARKGVNPFTKEPCVFKAKPASKTVKGIPLKKLKEMVNKGRVYFRVGSRVVRCRCGRSHQAYGSTCILMKLPHVLEISKIIVPASFQ